MALSQHEFYVYHEGAIVYARRREEDRVVVKECATPHEAYKFVQTVVNPNNLTPADFLYKEGDKDKQGQLVLTGVRPSPDTEETLGRSFVGEESHWGFLHPDFQNAISKNCRATVEEAYSNQ